MRKQPLIKLLLLRKLLLKKLLLLLRKRLRRKLLLAKSTPKAAEAEKEAAHVLARAVSLR